MKEWGGYAVRCKRWYGGIKADRPNNRSLFIATQEHRWVLDWVKLRMGSSLTLRNKNVKMINGVSAIKLMIKGLQYTKKDKTTILNVDHMYLCRSE